MQIAIFGLGYVGSTAAGCLAKQGHCVIGFDANADKVAAINAGLAPVSEPGLTELVAQGRAKGLLRAAALSDGELAACDIAFVCVGTPSRADGSQDLQAIVQVTHEIVAALDPHRNNPLTVAYRSTIRPGTIEHVIQPIFEERFGAAWAKVALLASNPEFMRETSAIEDYFNPPRIVIGTREGAPSAALDKLYEDFAAPIYRVGLREAEMVKFVDNSWHATKVAFANEIGRICQALEVPIASLHEMFIADTKLNISPAYLRPGDAFGGSCLPKDLRALNHIAGAVSVEAPLLAAALESNAAHKADRFARATEGLAVGAKVLLVGLSFKAGTDDLRESPAVDMARRLLDAGYDLAIYEPTLLAQKLVGRNLDYVNEALPMLESLLVSHEEAEAGSYQRVIACNRLIDKLAIDGAKIVDIGTME